MIRRGHVPLTDPAMARLARIRLPDLPYHVTLSAARR